ncbi:phage holin family protein [Paucilactobacillus kaifaensis]|uniref:phage holin family protein n=1 Tax=Paucilactobacillus kaifaensis TaxID=2559921 RepID=UPI0010F4BA3C|nr:phage holin family protein [Paucilactobacillus kaifaensis]
MPPLPGTFTFDLVLFASRKMVDNPLIEAFLWVVIFDMATGLLKSFFPKAKKKADSTTGIQGAIKHILIMVLILTIYPMLDVLEFDTIANTAVVFYISTYAVSILENLDVMGVPFPMFVKERFEKMAKDNNKEDK